MIDKEKELAELELKQDINKKIILAVVFPGIPEPLKLNGIWHFPDDVSLRSFRMQNKAMVWLDECVDKNCKKCNGTGKLGVKITPLAKTKKQIVDFILPLLLPKSQERIVAALVALLDLPENFRSPLMLLADNMIGRLQNDDKDVVADMFAKMLREDFVKKQQIFCHKCFVPNYKKQLKQAELNLKFMIN